MELLEGVGLPIWLIAKIVLLFGLVVYGIIGLVIVRQTNLMTDTLELGHEKIIRAFSKVHLILIIFVFILALVIL